MARDLAADYISGAIDEDIATTAVAVEVKTGPVYDPATLSTAYTTTTTYSVPAVVKRFTQDEIANSMGQITGEDVKVVVAADAFPADAEDATANSDMLGLVNVSGAAPSGIGYFQGRVVKVIRRLVVGLIILQVRR